MVEFYTVVTDAGREAVARATQAGEKVNITHMAVGDGGGSAVTPDESQTQLVNECWRGLVATYSQQGDSLIIDAYIPADEGNFTIREMGVFTADGVLFAVCNTPAMPKILPIKGAVDSFVFGMKLDVTNIDMSYIEIHTNPMLDFIKNSEKGQPNGVPILDEHGKIPADNMPANTPTLGEDGKIPQEQLPDLNFDTAGSAAAVQGNLNAHINNKQNPHGVTAAQVGAYTKSECITSSTALTLGLPSNATPNDAFLTLRKQQKKEIARITSSQEWTVPSNITNIDIYLVGGGGGGGASSPYEASGGGGGGYCKFKKDLQVTPGQKFFITIGAGGNGGNYENNYNGYTGGISKFGEILVANGGNGGIYGRDGNGSGGSGGSGGGGTNYGSNGGIAANGGFNGSDGYLGMNNGLGGGNQDYTPLNPYDGIMYGCGGGGGRDGRYSNAPGLGGGSKGIGGGGNAGENGSIGGGGGGAGFSGRDSGKSAGSGGSGICIIYG